MDDGALDLESLSQNAEAELQPIDGVIFNVDTGWGAVEGVLKSRFNSVVASGRLPHTAFRGFSDHVELEALIPNGFEIVATHSYGSTEEPLGRYVLATRGDAEILLAENEPTELVTISARTEAEARLIMAEVEDRHRIHAPDRADKVHVGIWSGRGANVRKIGRHLDFTPWRDLAVNYPTAVRSHLDALFDLEIPTGTGRLVLWHGPPGTGKTTAILSLAHAWREWAEFAVVSNAEQLFEDTDYLQTVLLDPAPKNHKFQVIVGEDADDYLRRDARSRSGPALGRLLNTTDGILGRGTKTIILLTSNDDVGLLHPALTRPGRCLNITEFTPFTTGEADRWLRARGAAATSAPANPSTLAELYQLSGELDGPTEVSTDALRTGVYL